MPDTNVTYIDETEIKNKRVLIRVDFDVSFNPNQTIANDARIKQNLPTIKLLLKNNNKLICVAKLNRPKGRDPQHSLKPVCERLQEYLPDIKITLVNDFLTDKQPFEEQKEGEILVIENIRFYPEEKKNDQEFAKKLAALADVYVNDAFSVALRTEASIVSVPQMLPSYGGLQLKKEIQMISKAINKPKKPIVAIIGGAKISTKITLIGKLTEMADYVIIGGGLANTFLCAHGYEIGKSYCEYDEVEAARKLLFLAAQKNTAIILPEDVVISDDKDSHKTEVRKVENVPADKAIYDIGPETTAKYGHIIAKARTIIWNGPIGYFENPSFKRGTDFIYYAITHNTDAISIVGGGDTLAAISKEEYLNKITHISTGGGAMLEFIEKGTLPGIEALKKS
jgi:phosphoglycerate kinase